MRSTDKIAIEKTVTHSSQEEETLPRPEAIWESTRFSQEAKQWEENIGKAFTVVSMGRDRQSKQA